MDAGCRVQDSNTSDGRVVTGEVRVAAPLSVVWDILTDFEELVDVVPNLQVSRLLPSKDPNKVLIQQVGSSSSSLW